MSTCKGCGRDHRLDILEHIEDYAIIERAMEIVEQEHPDSPPLSAAGTFVFNNIAEMVFDRAVEYAQMKNASPSEEVKRAITSSLIKAMCIGVATAHHFQDSLPIPTVHVTEEMVEEKRAFIQGIMDQADQEQQGGLPPEVLEFLKSNGIDPEQVQIMRLGDGSALIETDKKKKGDDDGHGMYL